MGLIALVLISCTLVVFYRFIGYIVLAIVCINIVTHIIGSLGTAIKSIFGC